MNKQEKKIKEDALKEAKKAVKEEIDKIENNVSCSIREKIKIIEKRNAKAYLSYINYIHNHNCKEDKFGNPILIN